VECGVCDKEVKSQDEGVTCDLCDIWYHDKCGNISPALYLCLIQECKCKGAIIYNTFLRLRSRGINTDDLGICL